MSARVKGHSFASGSWGLGWVVFCFSFSILFGQLVDAAPKDRKTFASPEEAAQAIFEAAKQEDAKGLSALFGPEGKDLISTSDKVADKGERARFVKDYEEKNQLARETENRAILVVGKEERPFPIPIVKVDETWHFDVKAGKEELINRRIGRNELNAIQACLAYVDAQREYALRSQGKIGLMRYAQKLWSSKGKKDGLYWVTKEGEEPSPLVAHPAVYGVTGIMTFVVNHEGVVLEKDLGKETGKIVGAMNRFDPDQSWKKAE